MTMENNYKGFEITILPSELAEYDSILPVKIYNKELDLCSLIKIEGGKDLPEELLNNVIRQTIDNILEKPERWKIK